MSTLTRARAMGDKVRTNAQANRVLRESSRTLDRAVQMARGLTNSQVLRAWLSRINTQRKRIAQVRARKYDRNKANAAALAAVQSAQLVKQLRGQVKDAQARETLTGVLNDFAAALRSVLGAAAQAAASNFGDVAMVLGAIAALLLISNNRRR